MKEEMPNKPGASNPLRTNPRRAAPTIGSLLRASPTRRRPRPAAPTRHAKSPATGADTNATSLDASDKTIAGATCAHGRDGKHAESMAYL